MATCPSCADPALGVDGGCSFIRIACVGATGLVMSR